ncbi:hypothetical protein K9M18_05975 [Candidatus Woesearchaeota archaeon]|nr:hypothetical protein [Candidatus Woesearchaeota archaeon]MCF8014008.1 hypothetical protein [Candidatus Woesearchaeota archaeon]
MVTQIISKAFFGKDNCLKSYLNDKLEFYLEFGKKISEKWEWKKVKMNDDELGEIINVLEKTKDSVSFFHDFKGDKTQIWVSKKDKAFFIKVKEVNKALNEGEQRVMLELLKYSILRMNMKL